MLEVIQPIQGVRLTSLDCTNDPKDTFPSLEIVPIHQPADKRVE